MLIRKLFLGIVVLSFIIPVSWNPGLAEGTSTFKKNRIKQLSKKSDRYNYYEEKNNRVKKGSKEIGLDARKIKGHGKVANWVEIDNSNVGNVVTSGTKRLKSLNAFTSKSKEPDKNLGVIADKNKDIDNTVIVKKKSKVENAILGGEVNTGIIVNSNGQIRSKTYKNNVVIEDSRVGGAAGLLGN